MSKHSWCIGLAVLLGLAASAVAAPAPAPPQPVVQPKGAATRRDARADAKPVHAVPAPDARHCLRQTGSLIPAARGQCLAVPGASYSRDDLERTGAGDLGRALQMLDPSVTVGH